MNLIEQELKWFQEQAREMQRKYPNSKQLPAYLELLERLFEQRKAELEEILCSIDAIEDQRIKQIAWSRLIDGLTYEEIAGMLHISSTYVQRLWKPYRESWEDHHKEKVQ